jgi:hypothetical protein
MDADKGPPIDKFKDGPYIFMPQRDDQTSKRYSKIAGISAFQGEGVAEFELTYDNKTKYEPAKATVRIRLDSLSDFISWQVNLGYVSVLEDEQGKDVIVEWKFPGMDMNEELWYAANGLQMMHKKLNQRE